MKRMFRWDDDKLNSILNAKRAKVVGRCVKVEPCSNKGRAADYMVRWRV